MIESAIRDALYYEVGTLAGYNIDRVAWPGIEFEPVSGEIWIRPFLLPNPTETASMGSDGLDRQNGLMQVSVFGPKGQGDSEIIMAATEVIDHFHRGADFERDGLIVRVRQSWRATMLEEEAWLQIPVMVDWFAHTSARG